MGIFRRNWLGALTTYQQQQDFFGMLLHGVLSPSSVWDMFELHNKTQPHQQLEYRGWLMGTIFTESGIVPFAPNVPSIKIMLASVFFDIIDESHSGPIKTVAASKLNNLWVGRCGAAEDLAQAIENLKKESDINRFFLGVALNPHQVRTVPITIAEKESYLKRLTWVVDQVTQVLRGEHPDVSINPAFLILSHFYFKEATSTLKDIKKNPTDTFYVPNILSGLGPLQHVMEMALVSRYPNLGSLDEQAHCLRQRADLLYPRWRVNLGRALWRRDCTF